MVCLYLEHYEWSDINVKLYLECTMGCSGDMFMAALYELLPDKDAFRERMGRLSIPEVTVDYSDSEKCGINGTHITVKIGGITEESEDIDLKAHTAHQNDHGHHHKQGGDDNLHSHTHEHKHYSYNDIVKLIRSLELPENVLDDALEVYKLLGEAEAAVHGVSLNQIHLHEVGRLDAVADIVGCCLLMNMLGVNKVTASPVHVGSGSVKCAHGILPVPAPAAAKILEGIPIYGGAIDGELCTPTGAALLKRFVTEFGPMPPMRIKKTGCGMGTKNFEAANCLRAFLYEDDTHDGGEHETVYELSCNLDDMTPEAIGAAFDLLLRSGALDVYSTPILMKKNRPAVMLTCLCDEKSRDELSRLMLGHTSTLGVRISSHRRDVLKRTEQTVTTKYGMIRIKHAHGFGTMKIKPEYDDVAKAARKHSVPFAAVYDAATDAARQGELLRRQNSVPANT